MEYILYSHIDTSDIMRPKTVIELIKLLDKLLNRVDMKTVHILRDMQEATSSVMIHIASYEHIDNYPMISYLCQVETVKQELKNL